MSSSVGNSGAFIFLCWYLIELLNIGCWLCLVDFDHERFLHLITDA